MSAGTRRPQVVVFDVNETLSDLSALAARFVHVGAPASLSRLWFASVLRDGFALTAAGHSARFADIGQDVLRRSLADVSLTRPLDEAVEQVWIGLSELDVHPDVVPGLRALHENGLRLATLSNGAASVAERLLSEADVRDLFQHLLSVEDAGAWKPARRAYEYAASTCGVDPADLLLVAVHPWDVDGAARAGLQTAWVNRSQEQYSSVFTPPTHEVADLEQLADLLG